MPYGTSQAKVDGRVALKTFLVDTLGTRWGSGKLRFLVMSCLMYGRLTSAPFSSSTTLRI